MELSSRSRVLATVAAATLAGFSSVGERDSGHSGPLLDEGSPQRPHLNQVDRLPEDITLYSDLRGLIEPEAFSFSISADGRPGALFFVERNSNRPLQVFSPAAIRALQGQLPDDMPVWFVIIPNTSDLPKTEEEKNGLRERLKGEAQRDLKIGAGFLSDDYYDIAEKLIIGLVRQPNYLVDPLGEFWQALGKPDPGAGLLFNGKGEIIDRNLLAELQPPSLTAKQIDALLNAGPPISPQDQSSFVKAHPLYTPILEKASQDSKFALSAAVKYLVDEEVIPLKDLKEILEEVVRTSFDLRKSYDIAATWAELFPEQREETWIKDALAIGPIARFTLDYQGGNNVELLVAPSHNVGVKGPIAMEFSHEILSLDEKSQFFEFKGEAQVGMESRQTIAAKFNEAVGFGDFIIITELTFFADSEAGGSQIKITRTQERAFAHYPGLSRLGELPLEARLPSQIGARAFLQALSDGARTSEFLQTPFAKLSGNKAPALNVSPWPEVDPPPNLIPGGTVIFDKKVSLVVFSATWCLPCKQAIPVLDQLSGAEPTLQIIMVFADGSQNPTAMKKEVGQAKFATAIPTGDVIDKWKIYAYPSVALINEKGNVEWIGTGVDSLKSDEFNRALRSMTDPPLDQGKK